MSMNKAMEFLQQLAGIPLPPDVHLLGPVPAPMERRAGRYRTQMLLQCTSRPPAPGHQPVAGTGPHPAHRPPVPLASGCGSN
ncbi:hypothetical protein ACMG4L_14965 [Alcanivorax sp. IL1]|uniref:hypothetical protein n=1 Tax=Alcanivorax sp. IL1 TaxID=3396308 RepID=UPI0039C3B7EC